eukprot:2784761-Prymnesium_polylepis.1
MGYRRPSYTVPNMAGPVLPHDARHCAPRPHGRPPRPQAVAPSLQVLPRPPGTRATPRLADRSLTAADRR